MAEAMADRANYAFYEEELAGHMSEDRHSEGDGGGPAQGRGSDDEAIGQGCGHHRLPGRGASSGSGHGEPDTFGTSTNGDGSGEATGHGNYQAEIANSDGTGCGDSDGDGGPESWGRG